MKRKLTAATLVLAVGPLVANAARAEEEPKEEKSLYERLGGLRNITPVVEDFVNHLFFHPSFNKNSAFNASRRQTPPSYLKFQFTQLVCEMSGGPCVYSGPTMKEAHHPLKVTAADWETMTGELKKSLDKYKVPAAEQEELIELFNETKEDIVERLEVAREK